ncbi:MAG: IS1595 family transposase, partial [Phycisphaerae bacterium]|nr:IS1595 family transposase [Phycisphaerae bacterium]NIW10873.1 IS1595 family transposase [Gammaproteobacteria bacterium]
MTGKNKYVKRSRISEHKFRQIVRLFSVDLDATQIAKLTDLNRNTINRYLKAIRQRLVEYCDNQSPFSGEVEVDESFFGARRVKGKRGRGAYGKTIVFGIFQRNGHVYTEIVPNCSKATLQAVIRGKVELDSIIYSDRWRGYNGLVDVGYGKHLRVDHGRDEFAKGRTHINGIEGFWGYAKSRLVRFRGMSPETFNLHLKECEFRFNHRGQDLYPLILKILRNRPLN